MNPELVLIDDDPILLIVLEKMFKKVNPNLTIHSFESGLNGLAFFKTTKTDQKSIALVDVNLKDISGWDFLKELESTTDNPPHVIIITSSVHSENPLKSQRYSSVVGFYEKPITLDVIKKINDQLTQIS